MSHPIKIPKCSPDTLVWLSLHDKRKKIKKSSTTIDELGFEVSVIFDQDLIKVRSKSRLAKFVLCRQIISYVGNMYLHIPLKEIGEYLGGLDHTTIIHQRDCVIAFLKVGDPKFSEKWQHFIDNSKIWETINTK